ncbi:Rid family hydrolase [Pseudomonas alliivorans]|nr:Rid family hydrolase [Pseudomonas alliivorans]
MCAIERVRGMYEGRNKSSAYKDLVWTVATAKNTDADILSQTAQALATIDENLKQLGASKDTILSAQVYIANMAHKPLMDKVWVNWVGDDHRYWPQRACLGVALEGNVLIEITVVAVRKFSG